VAAAKTDQEQYKVLVVFSYEENAPWDIDIREAIEKTLSPYADITFFYMDTKASLQGGPKKAAEAFALYNHLHPDGVIAVDDNAQSMFVVPYLRDKVTTPIMFCGVNAAPELYGYPTENISGILERFHLEESIMFSRQLVRQVDTFAFMVKKGPVSDLLAKQLEQDKKHISARLVRFMTPETMDEAIAMTREARKDVDLLFLVGLWGLNQNGSPLAEGEIIPRLVAEFNKPTSGIAASAIRAGILSAVITNGREHGHRASAMLLKAMRGIPVSQIPMTCNSHGKRMINVSTLKELNISPDPLVLRGVELVKTK
jgi:ABC-type uncharacterized transport system substrate-binding protein